MGGSGGGSSGAVDYPIYIKAIQADWLASGTYAGAGLETIDTGYDVTSLLNEGFVNNPWTGASAYNPAVQTANMLSAVTTFNSNSETTLDALDAYITSLDTTAQIAAELSAFDIGMRNVNAVHSSSFVIGRAVIAAGMIKEKLEAKKMAAQLRLERDNKSMTMAIETNRLVLIAYKEEADRNLDIDQFEAMWGFDIYLKAGNVLASIAGGTTSSGTKGPSTAQSAIGGGLSGAAAGAMIGSVVPGIGTVAGAAIGGTLGVAQAFL